MPTLFDTLQASIKKAADYNRDDVARPAVILWPDEKREWERLLPRMLLALPQLLTFGIYDPATRSGPAIWLRSVLAGKIPALSLPSDLVPVIYLPGVSRAALRACDDCPAALRPLAELQFRGVFWSQHNGKDWTVPAFLQSEKGGLKLRIARDTATRDAIGRAIDKLMDVVVADLEAISALRNLDGHDFDALLVDDPVDDLLSWLAGPNVARARWKSEPGRWEALRGRCKGEYGFDPEKDGSLAGAELLGLHAKPSWKKAWKRFGDAPTQYAGLVDLLRRAKPKPKGGDLLGNLAVESWPQDNEAEEASLRQALHDLSRLPVPSARARVRELDASRTSRRREWVWAKLGQAPLADALRHLKALAETTESSLKGTTTNDVIQAYTGHGWITDLAVLDALAAVTGPGDHTAVSAAIRHVYNPWLRDLAEQFQECLKHKPIPGRESVRLQKVSSGTCVFFADGLRFDLGQRLKVLLEANGLVVQFQHQTAALPTVTPTAKPAVSPVAAAIAGLTAGEEFRPSVAADGKELTIERFRKLLEQDGFQVLSSDETGNPDGKGWAESGNLDQTGHQEGLKLARRARELLAALAERIETLLAAGWREVRVVTDHGWLLVPGGLPKAGLPKYLTATRWGRCAIVKASATVDYPSFPWFWAEDVRVASPYGIDSFLAGKEYSHGGLSVQECVVPQLIVRHGTQAGASARIEQVRWAGLRCRVTVMGSFSGCSVDLRDRPADPTSSLAGSKAVGPNGNVALVVLDDTRDGSSTTLVLIDPAGSVVEKLPVVVGG